MQPCFSSPINFFPSLHPPVSSHITGNSVCNTKIGFFTWTTFMSVIMPTCSSPSLCPSSFCQSRSSSVLLLSRNSAGCGDVLEAGPQRDHSICPSVASEERPTHNRYTYTGQSSCTVIEPYYFGSLLQYIIVFLMKRWLSFKGEHFKPFNQLFNQNMCACLSMQDLNNLCVRFLAFPFHYQVI